MKQVKYNYELIDFFTFLPSSGIFTIFNLTDCSNKDKTSNFTGDLLHKQKNQTTNECIGQLPNSFTWRDIHQLSLSRKQIIKKLCG